MPKGVKKRYQEGALDKLHWTEHQVRKVNQARQLSGLPLIEIKVRKCLKCDKSFQSEGPQVRLCDGCSRYLSQDNQEAKGALLL